MNIEPPRPLLRGKKALVVGIANEHSIASHLVTRYFSVAKLGDDAIARLDDVSINNYHEYV